GPSGKSCGNPGISGWGATGSPTLAPSRSTSACCRYCRCGSTSSGPTGRRNRMARRGVTVKLGDEVRESLGPEGAAFLERRLSANTAGVNRLIQQDAAGMDNRQLTLNAFAWMLVLAQAMYRVGMFVEGVEANPEDAARGADHLVKALKAHLDGRK